MRALKIGVVMDPIQNIDINKDTTFVIMLEAQSRRHERYYMESRDLFIGNAVPGAASRPMRVARGRPHFELGSLESRALGWFDVILMRKGPPFDLEFFFAT